MPNWVCRNSQTRRAPEPCSRAPDTARGKPMDSTDDLFRSIDERRDELVELCRALIRFPTVNPPGEGYRSCAEFIGERMRARGFAVEYVRAAGTPGDSERYPRVNVIARREGAAPGPCVHF